MFPPLLPHPLQNDMLMSNRPQTDPHNKHTRDKRAEICAIIAEPAIGALPTTIWQNRRMTVVNSSVHEIKGVCEYRR